MKIHKSELDIFKSNCLGNSKLRNWKASLFCH